MRDYVEVNIDNYSGRKAEGRANIAALAESVAKEVDLDELLDGNEYAKRFWLAIRRYANKVHPLAFDCLTRRFVHGETSKQIAEALGVSKNWVQYLIARVYRRIEELPPRKMEMLVAYAKSSRKWDLNVSSAETTVCIQ